MVHALLSPPGSALLTHPCGQPRAGRWGEPVREEGRISAPMAPSTGARGRALPIMTTRGSQFPGLWASGTAVGRPEGETLNLMAQVGLAQLPSPPPPPPPRGRGGTSDPPWPLLAEHLLSASLCWPTPPRTYSNPLQPCDVGHTEVRG